MSRARRAPSGATKRPVVLVFGESENDTKAIRALTRALRPDVDVDVRRSPLVLIKGALPEKAADNANEMAKLAQQTAKVREVLAVLAHQDCDALEPAHDEVGKRIEQALRRAECPGEPIAVTPAWEIEAWWMVFPEAVGAVVRGWREPDDWLGMDVGRVENAKEQLTRAVRPRRAPKGQSPREYRESDSITIAEAIEKRGALDSFSGGVRTTRTATGRTQRTRSASLERFRSKLNALPRR